MSAISTYAKESSSEYISPYAHNPSVLKDCTLRVQQIIEKTALGIPNENKKLITAFECNISLEDPKDPVVTKCKHLFDRKEILEWLKKNPICPVCKVPSTAMELGSLPLPMENLLENWKKESPIPTFSQFKKENNTIALKYLNLAQELINEENYTEVLDAYKMAFKYSKASEDYTSLPLFYEKSGDLNKAVLAYLHLGLYQLKECKFQEALETLKYCKERGQNSFTIDSLIVGLELFLDPSPENLIKAVEIAREQKDPEEAIFIYKQIIECDPLQFEAYKGLSSFLDFKEKRDFLLQSSGHAIALGDTNLAKKLIAEVPTNPVPLSISELEWANQVDFNTKLPPYSRELQIFLDGNCPVWLGKKAKETHIVVPVFKNITRIVDGSSVQIPYTLKTLSELDKATGGLGWSLINTENLTDSVISSEEDFEWMVMTNDVFPNSQNIDYAAKKNLVESHGYQIPSLIDLATCALLEKRRLGGPLPEDTPWTHTHCRNSLLGFTQLQVNGFSPDGPRINIYNFSIFHMAINFPNLGVVGLRIFKGY